MGKKRREYGNRKQMRKGRTLKRQRTTYEWKWRKKAKIKGGERSKKENEGTGSSWREDKGRSRRREKTTDEEKWRDEENTKIKKGRKRWEEHGESEKKKQMRWQKGGIEEKDENRRGKRMEDKTSAGSGSGKRDYANTFGKNLIRRWEEIFWSVAQQDEAAYLCRPHHLSANCGNGETAKMFHSLLRGLSFTFRLRRYHKLINFSLRFLSLLKSIYRIYLSISPSNISATLSIALSINCCLWIYPTASQSSHYSVHLSVYLSIYVPTGPFI